MIRTTLAAAALALAAMPAQAAPISATIVGREVCELMAMGKTSREAIGIALRANWTLYSMDLANYGREVMSNYTSSDIAERCPGLFLQQDQRRGGQI